MVITGYRIHDTDLKNINMELDKVKRKLEKIISKSYHQMLGEEIAFICDNITLGKMERDLNNTIFNNAVGNLEFKINNAIAAGTSLKYNFSIYAYIMPCEDYTYIKVISPNPVLLKAFNKLEDYSLDEIECQDPKNAKTILWNHLHDLYKKSEPMVINLRPNIEADKDKIVYPVKKNRAETFARHSIINHLLNQISGGKEIPPLLLLPYMDLALEMLEDVTIQTEYKNKVTNLIQLFTDLEKNNDFVFTSKTD